MNKKLILLAALLSGIPIVAMDQIKERPALKESSHHEEERVNIRLTDAPNSEATHEVTIPVRLAKLIGAFNEFVEDPHFDSVWSLPNVAITTWRLIEPHLERVYRIRQDESQADQLRQEIITEFGKLDVKSLIEVISAADYVETPILLESACEVLKESAREKISWEELELLALHIRNHIIMHKVLLLLGPVPAKELALCLGHDDTSNAICVTKDGKIVSGSRDKTVRVWDMHGNQLAVCRGHEHAVLSVCVTKDGKILSGSADNTVRVWDMEGNQLAVCRGHEGGVTSVCVTKDGKIVSGSRDSIVRVWDMEGNQLALCRDHEGVVTSVCVTKDGKIVSGSYDKTVRVWDMEGNQLAVCRGHEGIVIPVYVTNDGKIVSGSWDETVRVWDIEGNQLAVCRGHEGGVTSVYVTKDSKFVSGAVDRVVRVWDMEGNQLAVCRGHEGGVTSVCVTKEGKIVSGSNDRTVRFWDMQGNQLEVCKGRVEVKLVCVTKDGKIVSGSNDYTLRVWDSGLLDRIVCMDEDQARVLWAYVRKLPDHIDEHKCWREIEKLLGEDVAVAQANNINNNNNE